jgi:hypothetical protein
MTNKRSRFPNSGEQLLLSCNQRKQARNNSKNDFRIGANLVINGDLVSVEQWQKNGSVRMFCEKAVLDFSSFFSK